jgi:hypothetical protein
VSLSLKEFAEKRRIHRGPRCWLCDLPERVSVDEAFGAGMELATIQDWLRKEKGYGREASIHRVSHHCKNHIED